MMLRRLVNKPAWIGLFLLVPLLAQGDPVLDVAAIDRQRILEQAAAALQQEPLTITSARAPRSTGGPHDFYSNADYWWPNPETKDGLPYVQRDGETNPGNFNAHRQILRRLSDAVAALGAAYAITHEDRYARKAAELLRVFFLDESTRMNPALPYAQAIPGVSPGRSYGIIDTLHLVEVPKAIEAMEGSPAMPQEEVAGLKKWFADYVAWLRGSRNGQTEGSATNNHAVAYWLQVAVFAQFTGDEAILAECRRQFKEVFLPKQMAADGSFPAELRRTKPYGYSIFQLDNLATLCQVLSTKDDDLWQFTLPDGRNLRKGMEFLYPFLEDKSKWLRKPDVMAWEGWPARQPCLLFAGLAFGEPKYLALWQRLPADPTNEEVRRNIAITQPVLWLSWTRDIRIGETKKEAATLAPEIRTPPAKPTPQINGPGIFGVRPGHPFLYHLPVTGERPMEYSAQGLPAGLVLDSSTGNLTGTLAKAGTYKVRLRARNRVGRSEKRFKIVVGETIDLTPAMGWNSWNHYGSRVTQEIVWQNARAMAASGLIDHGWTYINIDDTWQGPRGGKFHALQGNEKFPDLGALCAQIHALGLKFGIYSTPWETSYAGYPGGSSENPEGVWTKPVGKTIKNRNILPCAIAPYHFCTNDADQWAAWGVDYLKYDWNPIELPETREMYDALRQSGRDIIYSLSNNMNITNAPTCGKLANSWRTTGDIKANWKSMSQRGFGQDKWRPYAGPGHWNDPDMLEIATREKNQPGLTPDEEYAHMTLWCLLEAPLLLANDLGAMDPFTLNLLENDEVLGVSQDALGDQAVCVAMDGRSKVYAKKMEDGSKAVGLFNLDDTTAAVVTVFWKDLKVSGKHQVRDLWRQRDLGRFRDSFGIRVAPHSAELVRVW